MNKVSEKIKSDFLKNENFEGQEINSEEFKLLSEEDRYSQYDYKSSVYHYYKKIPADVTDKEIQEYISIKSFTFLKETESHIRTIKGILTFWVVLAVLSIFGIIIIYMS